MNNKDKKIYLVEFSNGTDRVIYATTVRELLRELSNYKWDSFMDITEDYHATSN